MALVCNACLGNFFFGYSMTYLNSIFPTIDELYHINDEDKQYIHGLLSGKFHFVYLACIPFGAGLGAIFSSHLLAILSRKRALMFADLIGIAGCLLTLIYNLDVFILARLVQGFTTGLNSALVVIYVSEYSPQQIQGPMGTITSLFISLGMLTSFLTSTLPIHVIFTLPIIPCLLRTSLLLFAFQYDPPSSYLKHDRNLAIEAAS